MLSVVMLIVVMLSVVMLIVIMLSVVMLIFNMLSVVMLIVVMLNVVASLSVNKIKSFMISPPVLPVDFSQNIFLLQKNDE